MEKTRKCFKCRRSPAEDPNISLFRFPKPGKTNSLRCELWAKYCYPNGEWHSPLFQNKLHSEHVMLCSKHFPRTSFSDYPLSAKKLHRFAVPDDKVESLPGQSQKAENINEPEPAPSHNLESVIQPQPGPSHRLESIITLPSVSDPVEGKSLKTDIVKPIFASILKPLQDSTNLPSLKRLVNPEQRDFKMLSVSSETENINPVVGEREKLTRNPASQGKNAEKKKKEKKIIARCRKHLKTICQLKKRINSLESKAFLYELNMSDSVKVLSKRLTPAFALLLQSQIKNWKKKKTKGRRWTIDDKITALQLYKRSPTCYRLMRRLFCLPTPSTLKCLLRRFSLDVGINKQIFSVLSKSTKVQKPSDNEYILMFDEMSIKKNLTYNKRKDEIEGYQDHSLQGRCSLVATQALVFMIAGIRKKVKQPIAYYLSSSNVTADRLAVLIKEIILECLQSGLSISATVCDMDGVNRRALAILGATVEKPVITVNDTEIVSLFDPPHLLKCFRNLFLKYDIKCTTQINSATESGVGIAKWSHIQKFYDMDNANPNFVFAPALKEEHLNPNNKQKMKVKLAAQVLSHTVAAGMLAKISDGQLSTEALVTVNVIENMDKLFDALNSDSRDLRRGKLFSTNLKASTPHLDFFFKMKKFFKTLTFLNCSRPPPSQDGWIWTLNAVERIWGNLTKKHPDIKSISTRRLQQDPLENLFGCIRGNCGANYNPTAGQFIAALKTSMLSNLAHQTTGNCEADSNESIINNYKSVLNEKSTYMCTGASSAITLSSDMTEEFERFLSTDIENLPSGEIQACAYVCGFLIKNLGRNCIQCKKFFITEERSLKEHLFIEFKEYTDSSLNYCTKNLINYVEYCATETNKILDQKSHESDIQKTLIQNLKNVRNDFLKTCPEHFIENVNFLTKSVAIICVKRFCLLKNRHFAEEASKIALRKKIEILKHK